MLRIGMLTSGGDCQALNAAMRGVVKGICNKRKDVEIYGFKDGYKGLIYSDFNMLTSKDFSGILTQGGTILGTSRQPFKMMRVPDKDGIDKVEAMKHTYHKLHLDCLVVLGGIQRIAKVSEIIVPFMAVLYVGLAVIIIITNITAVPAALASIVKSAFTGSALAGGAVGSMFVAMQKGVARGIFSNESGLGSAPIAAAAARTKEPVRQGLVSMTGTFIDTIVICTMTGLSIVIAGSWLNPELEGVAITMDAFQKGLPFPSFVATFSLMLCLVFFAFTTILGWNYYGERCVEYLFNRNKAVVMGYRILYILAVFIGPYMTVKAVWNIADIFNALMAFPNLIALLALNGVIVKETRDFHAKHNGSY